MSGLSKVVTFERMLKHPINPIKATKDDFRDLTRVDMPQVPEAIAPPTIDQTLIDRQAQDYLRRRRARSNAVVAGNTSVPGSSLATASLLGG